MRLWISLVLAFVVAGCGPAPIALFPVKGKLTKDGQPLGNVHLMLSPTATGTNAPFASADVSADGTFELKCSDGRMGVAAGSYKVVLAAKSSGDPMEAMKAMAKGGKYDPKKMGGELPFPAPYKDVKTSPKTIEINAANEALEIAI